MLVIKKSETVCGDTDGFAGVTPERITMVDQSPHQLAKAKKKPGLKGVEIQVGDAEKLTFPTNAFDRYVSCGSIEYVTMPPPPPLLSLPKAPPLHRFPMRSR